LGQTEPRQERPRSKPGTEVFKSGRKKSQAQSKPLFGLLREASGKGEPASVGCVGGLAGEGILVMEEVGQRARFD